MDSLKNTFSRVKETGLDGGKYWVSVTCKGGLTHTVWCGTPKLREGSDVFVPWQWPRADPPGCGSGHIHVSAPRESTIDFSSWSTMWRPLGKETRRDPCLSFHFSFVISPEFFSCCWLQDCEPSTLYQLDKWRNHSTLETKTLRTQQRKYNQVCNCFHFASSKAHWSFLASWLIFFSAPTEVVNISGILHLWNHSCKFIWGLISLAAPINTVICTHQFSLLSLTYSLQDLWNPMEEDLGRSLCWGLSVFCCP